MSNPEHLGESDPGQPDQTDQPYSQLDVITRLLAEAVALGDLDDPSTLSHITGDLSTLPPELRAFILNSLHKQEQANNSTTPPPDIPPPPETPQ